MVLALAGWIIIGGAADGEHDWPAYGRDKAGTNYSPLDQINRNTIKNLQIAWRRSALPEELRVTFPDAQGAADYQHTPIVVGGLMYISSSVGAVVALDPATGRPCGTTHAATSRRAGTRSWRRHA